MRLSQRGILPALSPNPRPMARPRALGHPGGSMTPRQHLLRTIADTLIPLHKGRILRVAIDGVDGAGKTTFADEFAQVIHSQRPVIRASVGGFHHPRSIRYRL